MKMMNYDELIKKDILPSAADPKTCRCLTPKRNSREMSVEMVAVEFCAIVVTIFGPSRTLSRRSGSSVAKVSANGLSEPRSSRQCRDEREEILKIGRGDVTLSNM